MPDACSLTAASASCATERDAQSPQTGTTFTHEALAVREALLADERALKRVLVLALHDKVRTEALAIRRGRASQRPARGLRGSLHRGGQQALGLGEGLHVELAVLHASSARL